MTPPLPVNELEILGYSNVLTKNALPSVVAPVFALRSDPERTFLPPYLFNAGSLCNSTEVPHSELRDLAASNRITLFEQAFPARADFDLWIDESFRTHYERRGEAKRNLQVIAEGAISRADKALRAGDWDQAEVLAGTAISADDRQIAPLVIKAAIRRKKGDLAGERLMARLAERTVQPIMFEQLVSLYVSGPQIKPAARATSSVSSRVRGMASEQTVVEVPPVHTVLPEPAADEQFSQKDIYTPAVIDSPKDISFHQAA